MSKGVFKRNRTIISLVLIICVCFITFFLYKNYLDRTNKTNTFSCFYGGTSDLYYENPKDVVDFVKSNGCNTLTVPLVWSQIEYEEGKYSFEVFDALLSEIERNGIKVIIVLDTGGRPIQKMGGIVGSSIPEWASKKYNKDLSVNFSGDTVPHFDYFSNSHIAALKSFYDVTIDWLSNNYRDIVVGIAPGIMPEFEIKYYQECFEWEGYTDDATDAWHSWLIEKYGTVDKINHEFSTNYACEEEIEIPIINYNESIISPHSTQEYYDFMEFREDGVVYYTKNYTDIIHEKGYKSIGYFGQFMFPLDAIYSTGVIAKCSKIFDIAVIDYNFFDGYKESYNTDIPAFLTNLTSNLGFETVVTGMYFERVSLDGKQQFVTDICNNLRVDGHCNGIEIGNVVSATDKMIDFDTSAIKNSRSKKSQIAIFTSELNFYNTHGEYEEYQNYLLESVVDLFHIIEFDLNMPVEVVSDKNVLEDGLNDYIIVFLPCQAFVRTDVLDKIKEFTESGGILIQDFRFGEYDEAGNTGCGHQVFGITSQQANTGDEMLVGEDFCLLLEQRYELLPSYYNYEFDNSGSVYTENGTGNVSFIYQNTMTWGFQPQLQCIYSGNNDYIKFIKWSIEYMLNR